MHPYPCSQNYGPHTYFLNQIWLEPWMNKWYHVGNLTDPYTPVYKQLARQR